MDWNSYKQEVDSLPFSADFQERTAALLCRQASELREKEYLLMKKRTVQKLAALAAVVALLSLTAFAAVRWLTPAQVADQLGQPLLAQAFQSEDAVLLNETVQAGDYSVTLEGLVSGRGLTDFGRETDENHTYAVVTLERTGGAVDETMVAESAFTTLVSGYEPCLVNNWTLGSSVIRFVQDGVLYCLLDVQNLALFADHTVYLAFSEGNPSPDTFAMAEDGTIGFAGSYTGLQAMFTLPLDSSKADPEAAAALVETALALSDLTPGGDVGVFSTEVETDSPSETWYAASNYGMSWFTEEGLETYAVEEKAQLQQALEDGTLSGEAYEAAIAALEKALDMGAVSSGIDG